MAIGAVFAAISAGVIAFGKSSIESGMEFDSAMSQVVATMGYTMDELHDGTSQASADYERLRETALEMGRTTAFTATEAADALNYMALAGYDVETSISQLPVVLNLAAAGAVDLASASDMVTDIQSALNLTLDETNILVDQMAAAASNSNTSVAQLGEALLTVGGTASYMAGGTEEVNAVLGVLADNGIKGSEAGTHLRNMLLSLSAPTENAAKTLDSLGVSVFDADGKMRSFSEIFPELNAAMADLTDQQKLDAFSQIFNTRDIASATALLSTTTERWDELGNEILDSAGAAEQMAKVQLDNLAGDVTLFKSALEGAKIVVSDQLTPALRNFVQFGTEGITRLTSAFQEGGLEGFFAELSNVIGEAASKILEGLPQFVSVGTQILQALADSIVSNLDIIVSAAEQIINTLLPALISAAPALLGAGVEIIMTLVTAIINNLSSLADAALQIILMLVNSISQNLPTLIPAAVEAILTIVQGLLDNLDLLIETAIELIMALADGLIEALPILLEKAPEIIVSLVGALIENAPKLLTAAVELISKLAVALIENIPRLIKSAIEIVVKLVSYLKENAPKLLDSGKEFIDKIKEGIEAVIDKIKDAGANLVEKFKEGFSNAWDNAVQFIQESVNGIVEWVNSAIDGIASLFGGSFSGFDLPFDTSAPSPGTTKSTGGKKPSPGTSGAYVITQNIYSSTKSAADLMREASYAQKRLVMY